ncbi:MAG TPA: acyltransferase [Thermoleophilaceae bacterium]|jgi:peptidoglycan/LPS O-acetylase OafA/YrhL
MSSRPRLAQIDLIKGAAVLGVIALHGLHGDELHDAWSALHFGQAVPLFLVLMATNAASSLGRRGDPPLRALWSRSYLAGRVERLVVPFAAVWLASLAIGIVHGGLHFGPLTAVGVVPLSGPGNYFVTIAFEFVLVFPVLLWAFRRAPLLTIAGCFAVDVAFELVAPDVFSGAYPYGYDAAIVRYFGQIALGLWIWRHPRISDPANRWILALAVPSVGYLVAYHEDPAAFDWLRRDFGTTTNFMAAFWAAALVLAGLRLLPRRAVRPPVVALAEVGRASWHVFLVQMVWFAVVRPRGLDSLPLHALASCAIGYALFRLMSRPAFAARVRRGTQRLAGPRSTVEGFGTPGTP